MSPPIRRLRSSELPVLAVALIVCISIIVSSCSTKGRQLPRVGSSNEEEETARSRGLQQQQLPVIYLGNDGYPSPLFPLGECQGDCDDDSECAGNLVCFQRRTGSYQAVPGCLGGESVYDGTDYCARRSTPITTTPGGGSHSDNALPEVTLSGNNGRPYQNFPLQRCQGDCDSDRECADNLVCFQRSISRSSSPSVPGCKGFDYDGNDFCVRPQDRQEGNNNNNNNNYDSNSFPSTATTSQPFRLKMYWEIGYYWQEERVERRWCLKCTRRSWGGRCREGSDVVIVDCRYDNPTQFQFVRLTNAEDIHIKTRDDNLCLTTYNDDIVLRRCRATSGGVADDQQRWIPSSSAASGSPEWGTHFELSPVRRSSWCMTQRHHPKPGERVVIEPCGTPRKSDTSYWVMY